MATKHLAKIAAIATVAIAVAASTSAQQQLAEIDLGPLIHACDEATYAGNRPAAFYPRIINAAITLTPDGQIESAIASTCFYLRHTD